MASLVKTGTNTAHDAACLTALQVYQTSVAGLPMSPSGQASMNSAEVVFHRAVIASCKANNNSIGLEASLSALRQLGFNS